VHEPELVQQRLRFEIRDPQLYGFAVPNGPQIKDLDDVIRAGHAHIDDRRDPIGFGRDTDITSPDLAVELMRGRVDAAFLRPEPRGENLVYRRGLTERLVLVFPSDHRLAAQEAVDLQQIVGETFIIPSNTAPTLRSLIAGYLERSGLDIKPAHEVDHLAHAVSMVASTGAVMLLPTYARNFLPWSVISRPLRGNAPTIDLVVGYNTANRSPILELFLSRLDEIAAQPHAP
jgi:LysR family hca operon transcriptional activator